MWRTMADGSARYVRVSGEPVLAADGRFVGYRGVGRDVTEEKRAEQLLHLEHRVTRVLSEARSAASGLDAVMRLVCEAAGWSCGRYFAVDTSAEELVYGQGWLPPDAAPAFKEVVEGSSRLRFKRGQGLAGLAWQSGEPIWSTDTSQDARVMTKALLSSAGRGAFVFPALA